MLHCNARVAIFEDNMASIAQAISVKLDKQGIQCVKCLSSTNKSTVAVYT